MLPYKKYRSAGYSWRPRQFERQFLNREADYEVGDYYWYWFRPCEIEVMDIEREQEYWEQDNVRYYHNHIQGRRTVEDSPLDIGIPLD